MIVLFVVQEWAELNEEQTRSRFIGIEERRRRLQARRDREQRRLERNKQVHDASRKMAAPDEQVPDRRKRRKGDKHLQREAMKRAKIAKSECDQTLVSPLVL